MSVRLPIIPPWEEESPAIKPPTENEPTETRLTIAGEGALVPLGFGYCPDVPAIVPLVAVASDGGLVVVCHWMLGEIGGVQSVEVNGNPITDPEYASIIATHYIGTVSQGVDPTIADAVLNTHGTTFSDTYVYTAPNGDSIGIAYSVFKIPPDTISGTPTFKADINGLKCWNATGTARSYTNNPALCLAHLIRDPLLGRGANVDATSLQTVVDDCAALVGGKARRAIGLLLTAQQKVSRTIETMRNYADCLVWDGGGTGTQATVYFAPSTAGTSSGTVTEADMIEGSFEVEFKAGDSPTTVATVSYTDLTTTPSTRHDVRVPLAGVATKQTAWREKTYSMEGIQDYAEAWRYGEERLNDIHVAPLRARWRAPDEALRFAVGDVRTLTHSMGLTAVPFKITRIDSGGPGLWKIEADQYDALIRSNATPTQPDTIEVITPPSPEEVITTPITGFTAWQTNVTNTVTGEISIHLEGQWNPLDVPNLRMYWASLRTTAPTVSEWSFEDPFPLNAGTATVPIRSRDLTSEAIGKTYEARVRAETADGTFGPYAVSNSVVITDPYDGIDADRPWISSFTVSTSVPFAIEFRWDFTTAAQVALGAVEVYISSTYTSFTAIPGATPEDKWANLNFAGSIAFPGTYFQLSGSLGLQTLLPGMAGYAYLRGVAKNGRKITYPIHSELGTPAGASAPGVYGKVGDAPTQVQPVIPPQTITPELLFDNSVTSIFAAAGAPYITVGTSTYVTITQFNIILPADLDWATAYGYTFEAGPMYVASVLPYSSYQGDRAAVAWTRLVRTTGGGHTHAALNSPLGCLANNISGQMVTAGGRVPYAAVESFGTGALSGTTQTFQLQARIDMDQLPGLYPTPTRQCQQYYWSMTVHRK